MGTLRGSGYRWPSDSEAYWKLTGTRLVALETTA